MIIMWDHASRSTGYSYPLGFNYPFTENSALNQTLAQYELPVVVHTTIDSDGYGIPHLLTHAFPL